MTRHTADSITDDELDSLYAELARLRAAVGARGGDGPRGGLSSPLTASQGSGGAPDVGGRDGASGGRTAAPDRVAAELRAQLADARKYAGQIEESLTAAYQCSNEAEAARAAAEERARKAERAANLLADSHRRAEQAETALARVRALAERWQYTGDRKGGPLPELRAALDAPQAGDDATGATP